MMAPEAGTFAPVTVPVQIKKIDARKRIVYGEVHAPNIVDTHHDVFLPEDLEKLAHEFAKKGLFRQIDVNHDNMPIEACVVETFIARGFEGYNDGAWVMATYIADDVAWMRVLAGELNGYSMEIWVRKYKAEVEIEYLPMDFGITEENRGHNHVFYITIDPNGVVTGGITSEDAGHRHTIVAGTATEMADGHAHRYFMS